MNSLFDDDSDRPETIAKPRKKMLPSFGRATRMTGLDIGATMIKAVVLERQSGGIVLRQAALAATPPGVVTSGMLTDGITAARALKSLWADYSMHDQRVASAVSGERVFCQMDEATGLAGTDLDSFVASKIAETLSYSPESASSGYQEVPGGAVWAAAPAESIDWIRETVKLSSKNPVSVETQSCALANAYSSSYQPAADEVALLIHVGARRASLVLVRGDIPLYGRDVVINGDWPATVSSVSDRVIGALDLHWDQIELRSRPADISRIFVSGGAAAAPGLKEAIFARTGKPVDDMDAFLRVSYSPGAGAGQVVADHKGSLAVAAGLALQGLEDA
jgi:Tfp pilus assembly PilM family ATPase